MSRNTSAVTLVLLVCLDANLHRCSPTRTQANSDRYKGLNERAAATRSAELDSHLEPSAPPAAASRCPSLVTNARWNRCFSGVGMGLSSRLTHLHACQTAFEVRLYAFGLLSTSDETAALSPPRCCRIRASNAPPCLDCQSHWDWY